MGMRPWEWAYFSRKWKQYKENKQTVMMMNVEVKESNLCVPSRNDGTHTKKKAKALKVKENRRKYFYRWHDGMPLTVNLIL